MTLIADDLLTFMVSKGRMPHLGREGDPVPWDFKGWSLPYVQEAHRIHPVIPDRWGYLFATAAEDRFPDAPIPEMAIQNAGQGGGPEVLGQVKRCLSILERHGWWSSFRVLVEWIGFSLGVRDEAPQVSEEEAEALYREVDFGPWLLNPSDHLGTFLSNERMGKGWNPNAFYPTPHAVVECMTQMLFHDASRAARETGRDVRAMSCMDPCVGTGRMLMHAGGWCMNLYGQDKDPFVLEITKINGALYVPWMVAPPRKAIERAESERKKPRRRAMPISKARRKRYGGEDDWSAISKRIREERAENRCEGSSPFPDCRAENGEPHPVTKSKVVLTVAHVYDKEPENCADENLRALCQRCHLTFDSLDRQKERLPTIAFAKTRGPWGWLSNMSAHPVDYRGRRFPTAEHLFQWMRLSPDSEAAEAVIEAKSPMSAKMAIKGAVKAGEKLVLKPQDGKDQRNMTVVLIKKLISNPDLADHLLATGDAFLVEDVSKRDSGSARFWGAVWNGEEWEGENALGRAWMEIRRKLREQREAQGRWPVK